MMFHEIVATLENPVMREIANVRCGGIFLTTGSVGTEVTGMGITFRMLRDWHGPSSGMYRLWTVEYKGVSALVVTGERSQFLRVHGVWIDQHGNQQDQAVDLPRF